MHHRRRIRNHPTTPAGPVSVLEVRQALAAAAVVAADAQETARIVHAAWWQDAEAAISESVAWWGRAGG